MGARSRGALYRLSVTPPLRTCYYFLVLNHKTKRYFWWLLESYLIDGIGVVSWLFWEYYFCMEHARWDWTHARWDWNEHQKTRNLEKLKFLFWVEGTFGDDIWWLIRGTLLMESRLLHDFFGNFSTILFSREGEHTRWDVNGRSLVSLNARWDGVCEVGYARWDTPGTRHLVKFFTPWYFYFCATPFFTILTATQFCSKRFNGKVFVFACTDFFMF